MPSSSVMTDQPRPARDPGADHDELVRARSAELTRLAYLVTGDRERAIDLAATALAGLRDEWAEVIERGTPQAEARAAVVRRLLPGRRRQQDGGGPAAFPATDPEGEWMGEGEHAAYGLEADDDLDPVVLSAYSAEPPGTRVALVLAEVDLLDRPSVAAALERDPRVAEEAIEAGLDRIGRARVQAADDRDRERPGGGIETHLRRVLLTQSSRAGLPADLTEEVSACRARTVRRRRLLTAGAGGLCLAAVGAVGGPALVRHRDSAPLTSSGSRGTAPTATAPVDGVLDTPVTLSWDAVWRWPARGSMVNDAAVQDLTRQNRQRVIYAERVGGDVLVITAQHDENVTDGNGLTDQLATLMSIRTIQGRRTAEDQVGAFGLADTGPLAVTASLYGPGRLVVLARPEVRSVEVSSTVLFNPNGTSARVGWQPLPLAGGVAQAASPAMGSFGMSVRYAGEHRGAYSGDFGFGGVFRPTGVTAAERRWNADQIVTALTRRARDVACTLTGLNPGQVSVTVTCRTTVPARRLPISVATEPGGGDQQAYPPQDTEVAVLVTTLPGGARLRSVAVWHPAVGSTGMPSVNLWEESAPYPAADIERRPVVLQGSDATGQVLGIIVPGASSVRVSRMGLGPGQKAMVPVTGRLALFSVDRVDETSTINGFDAKGAKIGTWPFSWPGAGNPWDLYG